MLLTGFYMYISFKMYGVKINQEAEKKEKKENIWYILSWKYARLLILF